MYTIYDYLKYYKNESIESVGINVMDNLLFSILIYLPIPSFKESKTLKELYEYAKPYNKDLPGAVSPIAYELLELIKTSKRYSTLKFSDFVNIKNNETQFGAVTIKFGNDTIISFKGTDGSFIGWLENFRLLYEYPTYTQSLACNYLKENITNNVYVCGHSKGGNLAMAAALENDINKIKQIYNFDGPGFRMEEYQKLSKIKDKLINILPTGSVVGTLLNNDNYNVVTSNKLGFYQHYPTSWNIFGQYFVSGKLSSVSKKLHDTFIEGLNNLDKDKLKETIEFLFESFEKEYSGRFNFNFHDFKNLYKNMKNIDPNIKEYMDTIIDTMINKEKN